MMSLLYISLIIFQGIHFPIQSQEPTAYSNNDSSDFTLHITGFGEAKGEVRIAMFDSESAYKEKKEPVYAVVLPVDSTEVNWSVAELPKGEYAIAIYHDKNTNGKLDTNFLGIPKERYGFSNDARGKFGPASWNDARFEVIDSKCEHTVEVR